MSLSGLFDRYSLAGRQFQNLYVVFGQESVLAKFLFAICKPAIIVENNDRAGYYLVEKAFKRADFCVCVIHIDMKEGDVAGRFQGIQAGGNGALCNVNLRRVIKARAYFFLQGSRMGGHGMMVHRIIVFEQIV